MNLRGRAGSGTDRPGRGHEPDAATVSATRDQPVRRVVFRHAVLAAIMAIGVATFAALR